MALNETRTWLIAYDIAHPRRLARVGRYARRVAVAVQKSLYVTRATAAETARIKEELGRLIDPREDDVRIYLLPERTSVHHYGKAPLPEGLLLLTARDSLGVLGCGRGKLDKRREGN